MNKVIANLFELQKIEFLSSKNAPASLRAQIPSDMLDVYERLRVRGRKAVALVRNGVCGECHLRIPVGTLVDVMHGEPQRCGNCGRFLHLPEDTPLTVSTSSSAVQSAPAPRRKRKKTDSTTQAQAA